MSRARSLPATNWTRSDGKASTQSVVRRDTLVQRNVLILDRLYSIRRNFTDRREGLLLVWATYRTIKKIRRQDFFGACFYRWQLDTSSVVPFVPVGSVARALLIIDILIFQLCFVPLSIDFLVQPWGRKRDALVFAAAKDAILCFQFVSAYQQFSSLSTSTTAARNHLIARVISTCYVWHGVWHVDSSSCTRRFIHYRQPRKCLEDRCCKSSQ